MNSYNLPDYNNLKNCIGYNQKIDGKEKVNLFSDNGKNDVSKLFKKNAIYSSSSTAVNSVSSLDKTLVIKSEKDLGKCEGFVVDNNLNISSTITFNQNTMIEDARRRKSLPEKLGKIDLKFNGLCELICNKVLLDDILGKDDGKKLGEKIDVQSLNQERVLKSHLLNVYSVFHKMTAFLFGIYPDNIFSTKKQWDLVKKDVNNQTVTVNRDILFDGLGNLQPETTLKMEIFTRTATSFSGHSMLVKKVGDNNFIFFDPNTGENRSLTKEKLAEKIDDRLKTWKGTDLFFTDGAAFKKRLEDKNTAGVFKKVIASQPWPRPCFRMLRDVLPWQQQRPR